MGKIKRIPSIDLECARALRREVEKIPPQRSERAAANLEKLKAAVERLESKAKGRCQ